MKLIIWAAPALLLSACASGETAAVAAAGVQTSPSATAATQASGDAGIDGLTIRYFRCDNGEAFTVQNYQNGSVRVTTPAARYDLQGSGTTYRSGGVTYVRNGNSATLTGAGGTFANCKAD